MSDALLIPYGCIPENWKYSTIEKNVEFLTGPAFDSRKFNIDGKGYRLVRGINLTRGTTRWPEEKTKYWDHNTEEFKKYHLLEQDILIGMDGSLVGKNYAYVKRTDLPAILVQRVARLRALKSISSKFIYYIYASDPWLNYVEIVKTNSGIPHISNGDIKKFTIPLPPLPEQQKIAAILSSVDEVIEKTQAQINKLKDLKTGMMQELLSPREGQAANINNPQGESKNSLHHTEFKDSPLGRIPVGWDAVPLSQLVKSERPITYGIVQTGPNIESGIPCVRVVDLMTDAMSLQKMIRTSSTINESYRRTILQSNDIMFALRGSIGHVRMTSPQLVGANLTRGVALISANDSICSKFLLWAIRSPSVRSMIMDGVNGSALQEIPLGNLRNVYIPLPPNEEQIKISKAIDSVEENLTKRRSKLKNYQSLKKALMQDLLTGKVRVKIDAA